MRPFVRRDFFPVAAFIRCGVRAVASSDGKHNSVCRRDRRFVIEAQSILRIRLQQSIIVRPHIVTYNAPSRMRRSVPRHLNCAHAAIKILFNRFPAGLHRPAPVGRTLIRAPQQIPPTHGDVVHLVRHIQLQILVPANIHRVQRVDGRFAGKQIAHIDLLRRDAPRQNLVARDALRRDLRRRNGLCYDDGSVDVILILILLQFGQRQPRRRSVDLVNHSIVSNQQQPLRGQRASVDYIRVQGYHLRRSNAAVRNLRPANGRIVDDPALRGDGLGGDEIARDGLGRDLFGSYGTCPELLRGDCPRVQLVCGHGAGMELLRGDGACFELVRAHAPSGQLLSGDGGCVQLLGGDGAGFELVRAHAARAELLCGHGARGQLLGGDGGCVQLLGGHGAGGQLLRGDAAGLKGLGVDAVGLQVRGAHRARSQRARAHAGVGQLAAGDGAAPQLARGHAGGREVLPGAAQREILIALADRVEGVLGQRGVQRQAVVRQEQAQRIAGADALQRGVVLVGGVVAQLGHLGREGAVGQVAAAVQQFPGALVHERSSRGGGELLAVHLGAHLGLGHVQIAVHRPGIEALALRGDPPIAGAIEGIAVPGLAHGHHPGDDVGDVVAAGQAGDVLAVAQLDAPARAQLLHQKHVEPVGQQVQAVGFADAAVAEDHVRQRSPGHLFHGALLRVLAVPVEAVALIQRGGEGRVQRLLGGLVLDFQLAHQILGQPPEHMAGPGRDGAQTGVEGVDVEGLGAHGQIPKNLGSHRGHRLRACGGEIPGGHPAVLAVRGRHLVPVGAGLVQQRDLPALGVIAETAIAGARAGAQAQPGFARGDGVERYRGGGAGLPQRHAGRFGHRGHHGAPVGAQALVLAPVARAQIDGMLDFQLVFAVHGPMHPAAGGAQTAQTIGGKVRLPGGIDANSLVHEVSSFLM